MIKFNLFIGSTKQKVIVNLQHLKEQTILHFLKKVINICELKNVKPQDLQMYDQDYRLPHQLSSHCIAESKVYTIAAQVKQSGEGIKNKQKHKLIKKVTLEQSNSCSSSQQICVKKNKKQLNFNKQTKNQQIKQKQLEPIQSCHQKKTMKIKKMQEKRELLKNKKLCQSSSSQESSPLPPIPKKMNKEINQISPTRNLHNENIKKKRMMPLESSSSQSSVKSVEYSTKVKQILQTVNKVPQKNKQIILATKNQTYTNFKGKNIPMSVRKKQNEQLTKFQQKQPNISFKEYQQQKWIPITKQTINEWKTSKTQIYIIQQNNEIRFKIIELDQEKFVPVNSGWITGYVNGIEKTNDDNLMVKLINVTKNGKEGEQNQYIEKYEMAMYNMQELQINKNTVSNNQKTIITKKQQQMLPKDQSLKGQQQIGKSGKKQEIEDKQKEKPVQSIEQFVCGQINYYFSDKNYLTDLFMQMHANQNESKYIHVNFLLNFPKIKKILSDEVKLWQYLEEDKKYPSRNYELDYEKKMIRKKKNEFSV